MRKITGKIIKSIGFVFLMCAIIFSTSKNVEADNDLNPQKQALDMIADFADRICKDIPLEGSGNNLELSGSASAGLNELIQKLIDLKIEGLGKYEKSEYIGVLREDLATAIKDSSDCKLIIFKELKDEFLAGTNVISNIEGTYLMDNQNHRIIVINHIDGATYRIEEPSSPWPWMGTATLDGYSLSGIAQFRGNESAMRVVGDLRGDGTIEIKYIFLTDKNGEPLQEKRIDLHVWYPKK
jgi:hypothetical protein